MEWSEFRGTNRASWPCILFLQIPSRLLALRLSRQQEACSKEGVVAWKHGKYHTLSMRSYRLPSLRLLRQASTIHH
ncbi:hypothetical protein JAAARDRAFT_529637 [Jaapia argillacea MUCL 33604]|uniref:Secreted protein n=1 Tax=Jaapia argillacea MUCL 33604 TaxID=933084 RepID=A0A067PLR7_9AGAM|nr:hypothetical protein JAAARDRAFT_529637 [Jaapia argillacea MUCL 33604]